MGGRPGVPPEGVAPAPPAPGGAPGGVGGVAPLPPTGLAEDGVPGLAGAEPAGLGCCEGVAGGFAGWAGLIGFVGLRFGSLGPGVPGWCDTVRVIRFLLPARASRPRTERR